MRHAAIMTSIVLTLMSALVLGQLFTLGRPSSALLPAPENHQVEETALAFYDAVNDVLGGGDDDNLRRLLHPAFETRQSGSSWSGTADDFLHHLESQRALFPRIQVQAEPVSIDEDSASVSLSVLDAKPATFAGFEVDPADLFGQLEFVRIERGLIIERWSSASAAGDLDAYASLSIDLPFPIKTLVTRVQEVPLEGDSGFAAHHTRHVLAIVKTGVARLQATGAAATPVRISTGNRDSSNTAVPVEPGMTVVLEPMDAIYLPAGTKSRLWNASTEQTDLIVLEFGPPVSADFGISRPKPDLGPLDGTLYSGVELVDVGDRLTLTFGSANLLPNSVLSGQSIDGTFLAWVTAGSLEVAGTGGEARMRNTGGNRAQLIDGQALLVAGETVAAGPGAKMQYRVAGDEPATVWFFSIVPAAGPDNLDDQNANPASPTPNPAPAPPPNRTLS